MVDAAACLAWLIVILAPLCVVGVITEHIEKSLSDSHSDRQ